MVAFTSEGVAMYLDQPTAGPEMVFDPFSEEFCANPHAVFRRIRDVSPVYYNKEHDFYALTHYEDVARGFKDVRTYSSTRGIDLAMIKSGQDPPKLISFMDPPEHGRMRGLLNKAFTVRAIESLRDTVTELVRDYLGKADPRRFDVIHDFSALFPVDVITAMLGVPDEFREELRTLVDKGIGNEPGEIDRSEAGIQAQIQTAAYYYNLVQERRAQPANDMVSKLIAAEIERDGGEISSLEDYEITLFAMLLGGAGVSTVKNLVGNAVAIFAKHTDQWQKLLDDRAKIPAAVEELLRYDGPVLYNARWTLKDVTLHGVTIPAGKPVLLCGASANRDPSVFPDPDVFDIDRDHTLAQHFGFGTGIHTCLGAALARIETAVALEHMLEFMPRYEVIWEGCKRVNAINFTGWSHLPVRVLS
jgi:cytochrome P450